MISSIILGLVLAVFAGPLQNPPEPSLEEKLLATIPEDLAELKGGVSYSPTGSDVAFWRNQNGGHIYVVGGRRSEPWVDVYRSDWSADGKTFAYAPNRGGTMEFGLAKGGKTCVVVNGVLSEFYDEVLHLTVSPQGKVAYVVTIRGKRHMVVDGKPGEAWTNVWDAIFSPDGKRMAYVVEEAKDKAFLWCDGEKGPVFKSLYGPVFSGDGRVLAVTARVGNKSVVVVDGNKGEEFEDAGFPALSRDGKTVAYAATLNKKSILVVNERKSKPYDQVQQVIVSANGKNAACKVQRGTKWLVLVGDEEGPEFDSVGLHLAFNRDGTRIGYSGKRGGKWVVFDGEKFTEEVAFASGPMFSPTSNAVSYSVRIGKQWCVVAGTKKSDLFDSVGPRRFSADGRKVVFGTQKGRELWWKVMDVE
jgi:hypothetical protein